MARAKKIDRAEARRRYRAQLATQAADDETTPSDEVPSKRPAVAEPLARPTTARFDAPKGIPPLIVTRPNGPMGSARGAYLPIHIREDLALLPAIATRTPGVLVPAALTVVAGAFVATDTGLNNPIVVTFASLMLFAGIPGSSAMGGSFIAGLLSPRAGWLTGLVASLISWAVSVLAVLATVSSGDRQSAIVYFVEMLPLAAIMGAFLGAFAAWYKRFLKLSTPQRPQSSSSRRQSSRPATKPRPARGR